MGKETNSNCNPTFIVLNISVMKWDSEAQQHQDSQPISVSGDRKEAEQHK